MWIVPQLKANVWVTLAKAINQDHMCLSMTGMEDPLSTCLVGIPLQPNDYPFAGKRPNLVDTWDQWTKILLHAPEEPQELALLGSSKATYCVRLGYKLTNFEWLKLAYHRKSYTKDANPTKREY